MPSKKKKYNARFPAGRIKKIMQSDEEVGKVAQAVPVIISRTLELFVESLLTKTLKITNSRNAKTLSPSHMKQCIMSESRFDFLRELVKNIPDISVAEESAHDSSPGPPSDNVQQSSQHHHQQQQRAIDYRMPSTSCEASCSSPTKNGSPLLGNGVLQIAFGGELGITATATTATKRRSESVQESRKRTADSRTASIQGNSVIQHTSDCTEGESVSPPKLLRMDSVPTATFSDSSRKNSTKRLMHQSQSVPCSSKEASLHQHHQHQPQQPVIPAPIVDINICNKPIVKIDYSNLVLPDKDSSSGSSSDQNSMSNCINPVINIDLSKITTQPSSELQVVSLSAGSVKSSLELDEDYDNI